MFSTLDRVCLDANHLPADLFKSQDLDQTGERVKFRFRAKQLKKKKTLPKTRGTDFSPLRILDASETQVTGVPAGVDAVDLQLGELERGVEGLGTDPDDDGVDR